MLGFIGLLKHELKKQGKLLPKWEDGKSYYNKLYVGTTDSVEFVASEIGYEESANLFYPYRSPENIEEDLSKSSWTCTLKVNVNALDTDSNAYVYLRINSRAAGLVGGSSTVRLGNISSISENNVLAGNSTYNEPASSLQWVTTSSIVKANTSYWIRTGFDASTSKIINSYSLNGKDFIEINSFKQTFTEDTKPNTVTVSNGYKGVILKVSDLEFVCDGKYLFKRSV